MCRELGITTPKTETLEIDHKQPLSKGGDNNHINLQWLCRAHNRGRGNRNQQAFRPKWDRRRPR